MKKISLKTVLPFIYVSIALFSCEGQSQGKRENRGAAISSEFSNYWFQGKAELTSYNLSQARYGELRDGEAVLIFVTEDFSKSKQVKLDDPFKNSNDAVKVLKTNFTRKFNTGLYPYSMMESVFTPVDRQNYPNSLKLTTSSQEWCGHTFSQLNLDGNKFAFSGKSYFESEGDLETKLDNALLESEIFNLIRLGPDRWPSGELDIIPSGFFLRLSHTDVEVQKANLTIENGGETNTLEIDYSGIERKVAIEFASKFPYEIIGWKETYKSGFGKKAKVMTTTATKKKTILLDYWTRNHVADSTYRTQLELLGN
ncbi:MAG: hypothetical protein RIG77_25825 [Cyclobacteriaceae bacterium]